jgi:hypothetical protein
MTPDESIAVHGPLTRAVARWRNAPAAESALLIAWAGGVAARWTLVNVRVDTGWLWMLGLTAATAALLWTRSRWAWLAAAVSLWGPLLFVQDWLTQTLVMLLIALVGALGSGRAVADTARWLTALTYLIAAFHKLNTGFLDPATGCAAAGWDALGAMFPTIPIGIPDAARAALAHATLATEVALFGLLLAAPRVGILVGLLFHIPLTWAFAPAFVFIMVIGYTGALDDDTVRRMAADLRTHWRAWAVGAVAIGLAYVGLADTSWQRSDLWLKTPILGVLIALVARDLGRHRAPGPRWRPPHRIARVAALLFCLNASGPYLGLQMQHTGAMLSNLRVDAPCWNHLLVPPSVSLGDPYIRVEVASLGVDGSGAPEDAHLRAVLTERLWNSTQLHQMRDNWCAERMRPIRLEGTHLGAPFVVEDLCDESAPIPTDRGVFGGRAWFPNYLRWQKNLPRSCPMACIH